MIRFALAIPHAKWRPERVESFQRLHQALSNHESIHLRLERVFTDRCRNWVWSEQMWNWGVKVGGVVSAATHFLTLQDDVIVSPNFWRELTAMVEAFPDDVIGLESAHPACAKVDARMISTSEGLIGVGYVVPIPALADFMIWRSIGLTPGAIESINEDTLLCMWCLTTGRRVLHPVPTIIDHDTSIPSTYGNDTNTRRRPLVTWRDRKPGDTADWWRERPVMPVGRFYGEMVPLLARRWVRGATDADWERWRA